jgi:hypothetical protein
MKRFHFQEINNRKKNKCEKYEEIIFYLPNEIIYIIFSCLPFYQLLWLKRLSKYWNRKIKEIIKKEFESIYVKCDTLERIEWFIRVGGAKHFHFDGILEDSFLRKYNYIDSLAGLQVITQSGFNILCNNTNIKEYYIGNKFLIPGSYKNLERVHIDFRGGGTGFIASEFINLTHLTIFSYNLRNIIWEDLKKLRYLHLFKVKNIGDLTPLKELKYLIIEYCEGIIEINNIHLKKLKLRAVDIRGNYTCEFFDLDYYDYRLNFDKTLFLSIESVINLPKKLPINFRGISYIGSDSKYTLKQILLHNKNINYLVTTSGKFGKDFILMLENLCIKSISLQPIIYKSAPILKKLILEASCSLVEAHQIIRPLLNKSPKLQIIFFKQKINYNIYYYKWNFEKFRLLPYYKNSFCEANPNEFQNVYYYKRK